MHSSRVIFDTLLHLASQHTVDFGRQTIMSSLLAHHKCLCLLVLSGLIHFDARRVVTTYHCLFQNQLTTLNMDPCHMLKLHHAQVSVESYPEWIQLVADFTIKSLNSWQWASASIFYLMGLWSRLVSSMPYLKGDAPSYMETCVPKIARAYITSRCLAAHIQRPVTSPPSV